MLKQESTMKASPWRQTAVASLSLVSVLVLGSCDAVQPKTQCKVRGEQYAARYDLQGTPTGMCDDKILTGEVLNLGYYRDAKDYAEGAPSLAIQPESVVGLVSEDFRPSAHSDTEWAFGKFTSAIPDNSDICKAPNLTENAVSKDMTSLSYKWSNFRVVVRPDSNARHFGADLVRKDGDCEATYKVTANSPVVFCGDGTKAVLDEMGNPVLDDMGKPKMEDDPTTGKPVEMKCDNGPLAGNALSPDIVYFCDATDDGKGSHLCLPKFDFPAIGKTK
jgi:hypothetical protein